MIQKIVTLLMVIVCLGSVLCGTLTTYASSYTGEYGVIRLTEQEGTTGGGNGYYFTTRNTGLRFIIEYHNKNTEDVYDRRKVGGINERNYYVNFLETSNSNSTSVVKLILGDNGYNMPCTFRTPKNGASISWEEYIDDSMDSEKNKINLYNFSTDEVKPYDVDLNKLANGEKTSVEIIDGEREHDFGSFYVDWKNGSPDRLAVTEAGIKLLASIMAARAKEENDTETLEELRKIYNMNSNIVIYVRAEILYDTERINATQKNSYDIVNDWLTYNQIRNWAYVKHVDDESLRTGGYAGGYQYGGKIDFIACKLYEDDIRFTEDEYGNINCSCNYVDDAGLGFKWYEFNGVSRLHYMIVEYGRGWSTHHDSILQTFSGKMDYDGGIYGTGYTINDRPWQAIHLPNICSMTVGDVEYFSLLNLGKRILKHKGKGTGVYSTDESDNNLLSYMVWYYSSQRASASNTKNDQIYNALNEHIHEDRPTIFEGWDYVNIEKEQIGEVKVRELLLVGDSFVELASGDFSGLKLNEPWTYEKQVDHEDKGYQEIGMYVENQAFSIVLPNDSTTYPEFAEDLSNCTYPAFNDEVKNITLTLTEENPSFMVTYLYRLEYEELGVAFRSIHWNNQTMNAIDPGSITTRYDDFSDLVAELYGYNIFKTEEYNDIVKNPTKTLKQKLKEILEMIESDNIWPPATNIPAAIKSINENSLLAHHGGIKYLAAFEEHDDKYTPNRVAINSVGYVYTHDEINNILSPIGIQAGVSLPYGQEVPNLNDIITKVSTTNINPGDELTVIFLYEPEMRTVTVEHRDRTTGDIIPGTSTSPITVAYGSTLPENPKAKLGLVGYSYEGYEVNGNGILNLSVEAILGTITDNILVTFWYEKEPEIDGEIIPEDENDQEIPNPSNPPTTGEKTIVLDDLFTLNVSIVNYNVLEAGSKVYVKFPFDVYYNNDFHKQDDAILIETIVDPIAGVIVPVEKNYDPYTFRLPSWTIEKSYPEGTKIYIEDPSNNIISEKKLSIRVIGRLYDFSVTNLEDDITWKNLLFNVEDKEYEAAQLPIGQHTAANVTYSYGMKLGSTFLYSINTKGLKSDMIQIDTKVIYVDKDGVIQDATLYYKVVGEGERKFDNANNIFSTALNKQTRLTEEVRKEISKGLELLKLPGTYIRADIYANNGIKSAFANVINAYKEFGGIYINFVPTVERKFGNFNTMILPNTLRLPFVNYIENEVETIGTNPINLPYGDATKYTNQTNAINMKPNEIINSLGHWYAEYKLPASLYVKDDDGNKITDGGYYIVLFKIQSLDKDKNPYLSYDEQWIRENPNLKTNGNNITFKLPILVGESTAKSITLDLDNYDGYYPVAIYQAELRTSDDYEPGGTH